MLCGIYLTLWSYSSSSEEGMLDRDHSPPFRRKKRRSKTGCTPPSLSPATSKEKIEGEYCPVVVL